MIYGVVAVLLTVMGMNIPSPFNENIEMTFMSKFKGKLTAKNARTELLEYKKLLDAKVITQDEFDIKAKELKKLFL